MKIPASSKKTLSHVLVGAVGATAAIQLPNIPSGVTYALVAVLIVVASWAAARFHRRQLVSGLEIVEKAIMSAEKTSGKSEFDELGNRIVTHVTRLASVAETGREQIRQVERVLKAFNRRSGTSTNGKNPSHQLTQTLRSLGDDARRGIARSTSVNRELLASNEVVVEACRRSNDVVRRGTEEINELASTIESIGNSAKQLKSDDFSSVEITEDVSSRLIAMQQELEQLRDHVADCERQNQSLRDQTVEIASLMQTIHEHSSKTDTMALNASIECVRLGEHGRGFASAAEEIRKLSGIACESAQDVIQRLQSVEDRIGETGNACSAGQGIIDEQVRVAKDLNQAMSGIRQSKNHTREHLDALTSSTDDEIQAVSRIATTLEELLEATATANCQLESEAVKRAELNHTLDELSAMLSPLAGSSSQNGVVTTKVDASAETDVNEDCSVPA